MMMRFEDKNFLSYICQLPQGKNGYLYCQWYNPIRGVEAGGGGEGRGEEEKIMLLLITHFLSWKTITAAVQFLSCLYNTDQDSCLWAEQTIEYTMWTEIKNDLTYGLNSTSKYLSSAPRKNISATARSLLTGSYITLHLGSRGWGTW